MLSRSWPARAGASLAAVVALVLVTFNQSYPYPWSGCVILALMFTGTVIYRAEGYSRPRNGRLGARPVAFAASGCIRRARRSPGTGTARATGTTGRSSGRRRCLLAGATFGVGLAVRRVRIPRWCAWLGVISYSVYLLHPLVFNAYRSIPVLHRKHTMPDQFLFFAGLLAVIIGLSALTYYLVEKPMQRLGRRVAAWAGYPTETASADGASAPGRARRPRRSRSASSSTAVAGGSGGSP